MSGALKRFIPMFDRVLLQRAEAITKTKGGIMIPEKAQQKVSEATVVAVGPGFRTDEGKTVAPTVSVGDRVLLPEFGGTKVTLDDTDYVLMRDSDLLGKFTS
ncbi:10 kDa heat shock protein, mitochondrial-like [Pollicipes pollicipes]|uniref:10 kDa heat shock protein, mitochondrial-like n=1 Tax=Pollicipes pollicipes TaxID=41117 RepID=UPI001884F3B3|nr:10 kDa heat shock protein, mitochondrial-like [Pollicipes pollicipes]